MFNKNFYPTKPERTKKLLNLMGNNLGKCKYILEPSAGKLGMVNAMISIVQEKYHRRIVDSKKHLVFDCIELDSSLQSIIRGDGYNLIWDDFLTFEPNRFYDLILLNPLLLI